MLVRWGSAWAAAILVLVASGAARGEQPPETPDAVPARTVEIVVVGSDSALDAVRSTIPPNAFDGAGIRWSRASRVDKTALLESHPEPSDVEVRAFVDLTDEKDAALYFADRAGERFLVRQVALPDGLTPLGRETLGQVLELSVRALLEDDQIGLTRDETSKLLNAQEPVPVPPQPDEQPSLPEEPDQSESRLGAEAFYAARLFSSEVAIVHGPWLGLGWISEDPSSRSLLFIAGQYELPQELVTNVVGVEWSTIRVQGGAGLSVPVSGSHFFAGGRLSIGADFTRFSPRQGSAGDDVALESPSVSTTPFIDLAIEGSVPLFERLGASARVFASVYPVRVHYDVAVGDTRSEVLVPYSVRPGIELSLVLR